MKSITAFNDRKNSRTFGAADKIRAWCVVRGQPYINGQIKLKVDKPASLIFFEPRRVCRIEEDVLATSHTESSSFKHWI